MYAVLLDVNSKQRFIFESPRLRESIGASHQITRLGCWVAHALSKTPDTDDRCEPDNHQWVSRSSGRVIVTVDDEAAARNVIRDVTLRALGEAPGMDVSGVYVKTGSEYFGADDLRALNEAAAEYALRRPPADGRFARMPFLAGAGDSALPAAPPLNQDDEPDEDKKEPYSLPSRHKRLTAYTARSELLDDLAPTGKDEKLARDPTRLERMLQPDNEADPQGGLSKVAIVHIDGNGVGAIMRDLAAAMRRVPHEDFTQAVKCTPGDADALRKFTLAVNENLDRAVRQACRLAWRDVADWAEKDAVTAGREYKAIPVVPVLLGGDDVTVITSGDYALPFAAAYLRHYEQATAADPLLRHLGDHPDGQAGPMTAAAGVAVVRFKFPFHLAYDLAERLVDEAKEVGKACSPSVSTLTYHVLLDTTVLDPEELLAAYERLSNRPFVLGSGAAAPSQGLAGHAAWPSVCERVRLFTGAISRNDDDRQDGFPRTRAARIRTMMSDAAQAELAGNTAERDRLLEQAENEWRDAEACFPDAKRLGGKQTMFDLMELTDLLPASYLKEPLGTASPPPSEPQRPSAADSSTGEEGQA
ncbi:Cas10/Cmr2 second palm domain-containing protein [Propionibacterium australiense]|uniref:Cas10/Cmr2 second palm domain-containing protein n=1 Tax=Propionibacterium australiense TaxID=119981 RepID=A0A383S992_9ACTN|nr:hypothetical protein [Propionibacterium australiense]RLP06308.1 hypothetical protein D9T14_12525 [Propionibacterium australiense]SYZ34477.1 Hypothetical protein PROPAUS_2493 [Propionibacterium australiense]VEH88975.1 Uncharacterised protein [Propionibacterium australiense]